MSMVCSLDVRGCALSALCAAKWAAQQAQQHAFLHEAKQLTGQKG